MKLGPVLRAKSERALDRIAVEVFERMASDGLVRFKKRRIFSTSRGYVRVVGERDLYDWYVEDAHEWYLK